LDTKNLDVRLEILFSNEKNAQQALQALEPDLNRSHEKRVQTSLKANKKLLTANIRASDEKALRGSVQSLLQSAAFIQKIQKSKP
jgi:tRNA threonylcarbamoyladenosine modification (KEOPS) complex  Pcc1 subunit